MTRFYGLKPPDFDDMTLREVVEYRRQFRAYQASQSNEVEVS